MEQLLSATLDMAVRRLCTALTVDDRSGGHAATIERCIEAIGELQKDKCEWQSFAEKLSRDLDDVFHIARKATSR